jgi:hypothetical protein
MAYTWLQFRNAVKSLMSDASISDATAALAISGFVQVYLSLHVQKNPTAAGLHMAQWQAQKERLLGYSVALPKDRFRAEVNKLITVDARRDGVQELIDDLVSIGRIELTAAGAFIDALIKQGALELQEYVELYRYNQERVFTFADAVEWGEACQLTLPEGCRVRDVYYVKDDADCQRMPVVQYDWQNRFDLKCGQPRMKGSEFYAAIDPSGHTLTVFPTLLDGYHVSVFYDGPKSSFADGDSVPFDEPSALAIADYVRFRQNLQSPANPKMAGIFESAYRAKRLQLYRSAREKQDIRFRNDSPFPNVSSLCGCAICTDSEDSGGGSGSGSTGGCDPIITVETIEEMLALPSMPCRKLIFVRHPSNPSDSKVFSYEHGNTTEANGGSVLAPTDNLGRFFEYNLA